MLPITLLGVGIDENKARNGRGIGIGSIIGSVTYLVTKNVKTSLLVGGVSAGFIVFTNIKNIPTLKETVPPENKQSQR